MGVLIINKTKETVDIDLQQKYSVVEKRNLNSNIITLENNRNKKSYDFFVIDGEIFYKGKRYCFEKLQRKSNKKVDSDVKSPMPGKIININCSVGDTVIKGTNLIVMEAMKMQHAIKAPFDLIVEKLFYREGEQVLQNVDLIEYTKC